MIDNRGVLKLECVRTLHVEWAKEVKGGIVKDNPTETVLTNGRSTSFSIIGVHPRRVSLCTNESQILRCSV
jgi:hypothetical protein